MSTLKFKTSLDSTQYDKGVENIKSKNTGLGGSLGGIQGMIGKAFAIGAVVAFGKAVIDGIGKLAQFGAALHNTAARSGVSVEGLQGFQEAVVKNGGSVGDLDSALQKLQESQNAALTGDKKAIENFDKLGISMDQIAKLDTEGLFKAISQSMYEGGTSANEMASAADLLGKEKLPFLKGAMLEIGAAGGELASGWGKVSGASAAALAEMSNEWKGFWKNAKEWATNGIGTIANALAKGLFGKDLAAKGLQKQADLQEEQMQQRIADAEKVKKAELEKNKEVSKEKKKELSGIEKETAKIEEDAAKRFGESTAKGDKFAAIGGRLGGFESQQLQLARQQVEIAKRTEEYLAKIAENTKDGTGLA
jgi:hypothetical protein